MYNVPSFTLARAIGGLISWYWLTYRKSGRGGKGGRQGEEARPGPGAGAAPGAGAGAGSDDDDETMLIVLASGLILGEGLVSIVNLILASLRVPHL